MYCHSQEHKEWLVIQWRIAESMSANDQHREEQNTFNRISYFLYAWCVYIAHTFFYYTKAMLMRREHRNNSPTTTAFGLYHTGALNN